MPGHDWPLSVRLTCVTERCHSWCHLIDLVMSLTCANCHLCHTDIMPHTDICSKDMLSRMIYRTNWPSSKISTSIQESNDNYWKYRRQISESHIHSPSSWQRSPFLLFYNEWYHYGQYFSLNILTTRTKSASSFPSSSVLLIIQTFQIISHFVISWTMLRMNLISAELKPRYL